MCDQSYHKSVQTKSLKHNCNYSNTSFRFQVSESDFQIFLKDSGRYTPQTLWYNSVPYSMGHTSCRRGLCVWFMLLCVRSYAWGLYVTLLSEFFNVLNVNYNLRGASTRLMLPSFNLEYLHKSWSYLTTNVEMVYPLELESVQTWPLLGARCFRLWQGFNFAGLLRIWVAGLDT